MAGAGDMFVELDGAYIVPDELVTERVGIRYETDQYDKEDRELRADSSVASSCATVRFSQGRRSSSGTSLPVLIHLSMIPMGFPELPVRTFLNLYPSNSSPT